MPTYQYRCLQCRQTQSLLQNMQDSVAPACTACGGFTEKIIGQAPLILKSEVIRETPPPDEPTHRCDSACALHQPWPQKRD